MSEVPKQFNTKGGKNYKKHKTGRVRAERKQDKIDVDGGEGYYATITKMCGCDNVMVQARENNEIYRVQIPGKMYNRGGSRNKMKVGDEVLVLGPLDKNVIGVINRIVRNTDVDFANATKGNKNGFDDDDDEEVDDTYEALVRMGKRGGKGSSHKGGEKQYSTEEEIAAGVSNVVLQNNANSSDSDSPDDSDNTVPDLSEI